MQKNRKHNPLFHLSNEMYFPPVEDANAEGLLAIGGDLSVERLLLAYQSGIFPWFNEDSLILWWSPDPRMVLDPNDIKISKSMRNLLRSKRFRLTRNTCFEKIITHCAKVDRPGQDGTWITPQMKSAYIELHEKGLAISYEVWEEDRLVGGLYGLDMGHVFCGESMFATQSNASKFAFIKLAQDLAYRNYQLIDCQVYTKHLASLGAKKIPRKDFIRILTNKG